MFKSGTIVTMACILLAGSMSLILIYSPLAQANAPTCIGNFAYTTFDSIVVPAGNTCQLDQFNVVHGNITVEKGATLVICPDNDVKGNVKAHGAYSVFISDVPVSPCGGPKALGITIGGNVDIKDVQDFSLIGNPSGVTSVDGNVMIKRTQNVLIENFDGIAGNVEAKNNVTVSITGNTIDGNLIIRGTTGSCTGDDTNNSVSGNTDACS